MVVVLYGIKLKFMTLTHLTIFIGINKLGNCSLNIGSELIFDMHTRPIDLSNGISG